MKTGKKTLLLGIVTSISGMLFTFRPNGYVQLILIILGGILLVATIVNLIKIPLNWRQQRKLSALPFTISIFSVLLLTFSIFIGMRARIMKFRYDMPYYENLISMMKKGEIDIQQNLHPIDIPLEYAHLAYATLAVKDKQGVLTVEFLSGSGFPVKHSGWLYREDDNPMAWKDISRWPRIEKIEPKWYRIGD